ncbi:hypothetical protein Btru_041508 [Bulinus truncatus]|nr:hypothetical protein Btru_041508 [Bulinus truncatus]
MTKGLYNAALYKPAVQSTTFSVLSADLAVDGNKDSDATHEHCQHTQGETMPWWMVDLRGQFVVDTIVLTNSITFTEVLHICEMEVLVSEFLYGESRFNIQVDTKLSGLVLDSLTVSDPSRCIEECLARGSSTCTAVNWVTTSKTCQLFSINTNKDLTSYLTMDGGYSTRLRNFTVDIFENDPRKFTNFPNITGHVCYEQDDSFTSETLDIACYTTGRFVRLLINGSGGKEFLDICEMEVFVSDFLSVENLFARRMDTKLTSSELGTVSSTNPVRCVQECLARRSSTCTAFNWVTTSKTCQLFSVNPKVDTGLKKTSLAMKVTTLFSFFLVRAAVLTFGLLYNAALYKPAVQSSTFLPFVASRAVDGNKDDNMFNGHCQHNRLERMPWWMVDLRGQFVVDTIRLTNRGDTGYLLRLRNFQIDIFQKDPRNLVNFPNITGDLCYNQTAPLYMGTFDYKCPSPFVGRFVRISMKLNTTDYLHICEMEVLVSDAIYDDFFFTIKADTKLSGSVLDALTVSDSSGCVQECLSRRSSRCTAFNWVTTSNTCELFSVNPNTNLTSNLTSAQGTNFYLQNNSL